MIFVYWPVKLTYFSNLYVDLLRFISFTIMLSAKTTALFLFFQSYCIFVSFSCFMVLARMCGITSSRMALGGIFGSHLGTLRGSFQYVTTEYKIRPGFCRCLWSKMFGLVHGLWGEGSSNTGLVSPEAQALPSHSL